MFFILCALSGWLCPLPSPAAPPVTAVNAAPITPITEGDTGPLWGSGQPWTGITDKDAGHCPGYDMPTGEGARPSLSWPVPGGVLHEGRGFRVGHPAIDILSPDGSPVLAAASGTVIWAGVSTWCGGDCQVIAIAHGGGFFTLYFHLSVVSVSCGRWVGVGEQIGLTGQTGSSNFPHLHFEIRNGSWSYEPVFN